MSHRADYVVQGGHIGPQSSRRLGGHLQSSSEDGDRELGMRPRGQPQAEIGVGLACAELLDDLQNKIVGGKPPLMSVIFYSINAVVCNSFSIIMWGRALAH